MFEGMKTSDLTLYSILTFLVLENLLNIYLTLRQIRVYRTSSEVPRELQNVMKKETFEKARLYGLDRSNYDIFKTLVCDVTIISLELYYGFVGIMWKKSLELSENYGIDTSNEIYVSLVFMTLINIVGLVKDLPFRIYSTFVLEEKHGFNKQTPGFFIKDQIKSFIVGQVLTIPIVAAFVYIVQIGGDYFFVWLWLFIGLVALVLITIYPVYIAPLFDKFRPLEDGELKTQIEQLAASLKFPLGKLFVVEGSKRSAHSNAYFTGLFGAKRIVLFDTLLLNKGLPDGSTLTEDEKGKGCENKEVLAVLAHELGHWKLGHIMKNIIIMQVQLFLIFIVFSRLFKYSPLYQAVGLPDDVQPILIGFLVIVTYVFAPYNTLISMAMTMLSRRYEYQADAFAASLGYSEELGKALIKLNLDNLGFPVYDWMYSAWNHSHPTLLQRLERLKTVHKKDK